MRTAHTLPETRRRGLRMTFIIASGVFDAWQTDPVIVLCILQLGDLRSTRLGLTHGAVEANPLVSSMGLWATKLLCVAIVAVIAWRARKPSLMWAVCALCAIIVGWNLRDSWKNPFCSQLLD